METRTLTQLSPSKLTTYMTCPVKFYARYILGIKSPPSPGMLLGRAVHKALELLGRRRQLELDVTLDDVLSEFHESWRCELEDCEHELDEKKTAKAIKGGEPMIRAYWERFAEERPEASELRLDEPLINPATGAREPRHWEVYSGEGELNLVGVIDSLVAEDDGLVIVDFKTTSRTSSPATIALVHRIQMLAYAYLLQRATDHKVKALEVRQIVNKKEPEVAVCRMPLPEQLDFSQLFLVVENLLDSLQTNRWMPRFNFLCSQKCEGYSACH